MQILDAPVPDGAGVRLPLTWDDTVHHVAVGHADPDAEALELARTLADVAAAGLARLEAERRRARGPRRTTRSSAPRARSTPRSSCRRSCARSPARPRSRSAATSRASTSATRRRRRVATAGHGVPDGWHGLELAPRRGRRRGRGRAGRDVRHRRLRPRRRARPATSCPALLGARGPDGRGTPGSAARCRSPGSAPHRITDEDRRTLEAIADLATVACRNAETYEHVQHAARTDALTGAAQPRRDAGPRARGDRPRARATARRSPA